MIEADAARTAAALADRLGERGGLGALERRLKELGRTVRARIADEEPEASAFLDAIELALPDDAIVVCDMCIPGYWLGGFHRTPAPRKLSYPLGWGTLGCAFPQGLGAALAGAGPAVSISGDGGFLYACGELAAAKQENIPLTAVIVEDGGYGMIRYDQDLHGDPREGVDLTNPDFVALAAAFGIRADSRGWARRALRRGAEGPRGAEGADDAGGARRPRAAAERVAALVPAVTRSRAGRQRPRRRPRSAASERPSGRGEEPDRAAHGAPERASRGRP